MVGGGEVEGAGRRSKGGRERSEGETRKDQSGRGGGSKGDEAWDGYRAESSPSQSIRMGLTGAPLLVLTRFVLVLVGPRGEDRISCVESHTRAAPVYLVKADGDTENVRLIIDTCFSRGASQPENSSSGKRVLFVALLLAKGDQKRHGTATRRARFIWQGAAKSLLRKWGDRRVVEG